MLCLEGICVLSKVPRQGVLPSFRQGCVYELNCLLTASVLNSVDPRAS